MATLPFGVLRQLCDVTPLSTDDGLFLRKMSLEIGVVHLLLACLSALSHHSPRKPTTSNHQDVRHCASPSLLFVKYCIYWRCRLLQIITVALQSLSLSLPPKPEAKPAEDRAQAPVHPPVHHSQQQYWAKGTGFGTGSTMSSWDSEQTMLKKKIEEEHVTGLVQVLAVLT